MVRSELIERVTRSVGNLYQKDVDLIINTIFGEISDALKRGDRVELRGFGVFSVKARDPRVGRNPKNGEVVSVDGKRAPRFKSSKEVFARLNLDYVPPSDQRRSG